MLFFVTLPQSAALRWGFEVSAPGTPGAPRLVNTPRYPSLNLSVCSSYANTSPNRPQSITVLNTRS